MDWRDFAVQLAALARDLQDEESVDATLAAITSAAVRLVPGCESAGILWLKDGVAVSLAPTDQLVLESDHLQERCGEGPCFDAARLGHPVFRVRDMTSERTRWRQYAPEAEELGVGSMMGFLLYTNEKDLGALNLYATAPEAFNLYATAPEAFTEECETAGWLFSSHAAVAFAAAREQDQLNGPWRPGASSAKQWAWSWPAITSASSRLSTYSAATHRKRTSSCATWRGAPSIAEASPPERGEWLPQLFGRTGGAWAYPTPRGFALGTP